MTLDNILEEIKKAENIIILTHESPDGDAIGSSLALYIALSSSGKKVDLVIPEYPKTFTFLPQTDKILTQGTKEKYDLAIAVDCATIQRLNGFGKYFEDAKFKISIDHHSKNTMFGDLNYVDPASPACAQILIGMFNYFAIPVTKEIGTCLLTGIITDTGGFKYQNTTKETFEFAAGLLEKGVNVSDIYRRVLEVKTKTSFEITKLATDRIAFLEEGRIAFTYTTNADKEELNLQTGDTEGIVEVGRAVEGVEVSIYLKENDKGGYKASLRSNNEVNVSEICLLFGGGGHIRAAGCEMQGSLEQCREKILNKVKLYLK